MKIAVIGANGQLGFAISAHADSRGWSVARIMRADLDVTDFRVAHAVVSALDADIVFNCTAYNAVDIAESEIDQAMATNATAVAGLASACRVSGKRFVHFSTDYVFGHGHVGPISESEPAAPLSAYGRSKRLGEELALQNNPGNTLVVRSTGLYSDRRKNFVKTMLMLARKGTPLKVVADQVISPTWVEPLAEVSLELSVLPLAGIVHAVSGDSCTWFELASKAFELSGLDAQIETTTTAEWNAAAARPEYSALDNVILRNLGLDHFLKPWDVMLERFLVSSDQI